MHEFSSVVLRVSWSVGIETRRYTYITLYGNNRLDCMCTKVMDYIFSGCVSVHFLKTCPLVSPEKYEFMPKLSSCTQLVTTLNDWAWYVNKHFIVDFAKASDTLFPLTKTAHHAQDMVLYTAL